MGITAENVAERCKVSREAQDEWAVTSQNRAVAARDERPLRRRDRRGHDARRHEVTRDDGPRPGTTMEKLAELKPAFEPENGTVTAGNACPLNDGAAAVLVMSEEKAKALGLEPRARIIASSVAAIRPEIMGLGPIPAVKAVLEQAGMTIDDIDVVELNEAFAAQVVPCREELGHRPREAQPVRRRDRARPPVRDDRRAHHDHAAQRPRRDRRHDTASRRCASPAAWARR